MFWADRTNKVAGVTLLLLVALVIVNTVLVTAAVGDADPLKRGDIEGMLRDINDNEALYFLGIAFSIATDAAVLLAAAVMLYLVFRDRSRVLAMLGFAGLLAAGIAFLAADTASLTVGVLAADFVEKGGAGGIAAGDPVILQSARAAAAFAGSQRFPSRPRPFHVFGKEALEFLDRIGRLHPARERDSDGAGIFFLHLLHLLVRS